MKPVSTDAAPHNEIGAHSGIWVVSLDTPIPGVRWESFIFWSQEEADEFQSCIAAEFPEAVTKLEPSGTPQAIFPGWSW